jgi:putative transposase
MKHTRYQRRSTEQWQTVMEKFHHSELSAPTFCKKEGIVYASFCSQRKKMEQPLGAVTKPAMVPPFIDLQTLAAPSGSTWNIILKLGNGVELNLSQA